MLDQVYQKGPFRLIVPVSLFDGAAAVADGIDRTPRLIRSKSARRQILLFENFQGLQFRRIDIAGVLQNQRLGAIADHHPLAVSYQKRPHLFPPKFTRAKNGPTFATLFCKTRPDPFSLLVPAIQFVPSSSRRAITWAWISAAPSKILSMRASHRIRDTGNSRAKPLPPCTCTALSAAAQATRAASSLAMPASRSQRLPESFSRSA